MASSTLVRWSGLAAVLAGVLFAAWGYIHRDDTPSHFTAIVNTLAFIVPLFFLVGLVGLYARCEGRAGWLGGVGFTLSLIGSVWGLVRSVVDVSFWHTFWRTYAPGKEWLPFLLDWLPLLFNGLILVGIAIIGAKILRNWGSLLLMTGLFGWAYCFTDSGRILETRPGHVVFGILFSLGWMVLGYALWSERGVADQRENHPC